MEVDEQISELQNQIEWAGEDLRQLKNQLQKLLEN